FTLAGDHMWTPFLVERSYPGRGYPIAPELLDSLGVSSTHVNQIEVEGPIDRRIDIRPGHMHTLSFHLQYLDHVIHVAVQHRVGPTLDVLGPYVRGPQPLHPHLIHPATRNEPVPLL